MLFEVGKSYHVYNRGNNGQPIFFSDRNYLFFLNKLKKELLPFCEILCYCLMPNHFHLMVFIKSNTIKDKTLNDAIVVLLRSYTRAINIQENRTGSLFQQKTKAKELVDQSDNFTVNYAAICAHYIHQNPLRARLTSLLESWKFSSYPEYANLSENQICKQDLFYSITEIKHKDFIQESHQMISDDFAEVIR